MKVVWCDTETTGLEPENSGAFQIAILYKHGADPTQVWTRIFYLNPLDEAQGIIYHDESYNTHGVSKETIESYDKAADVMPKIAEFFAEYSKGFKADGTPEKLTFAGYNCPFDWKHLNALFQRYTKFQMSDFFEPRTLDVYQQVKRARDMGRISTINQKLGTVCKSLNVSLENAHDAMGDITATRLLAIRLDRMGVPLIV